MATWLLFGLKNELGNKGYPEVKTAELEDAALAKAQILGVTWMFQVLQTFNLNKNAIYFFSFKVKSIYVKYLIVQTI